MVVNVNYHFLGFDAYSQAENYRRLEGTCYFHLEDISIILCRRSMQIQFICPQDSGSTFH
jgi:hypothetical protein